VKFDLNQQFLFRTTPDGEAHLRRAADEDAERCAAATNGRIMPSPEDLLPTRLGDGRWEMTAWEFMRVFGPTFDVSAPTMIEDNLVELGRASDFLIPSA
jgi:hypothetical protein